MKDLKETSKNSRTVFYLLVFICTIFIVAVLKIASSVILPFTIAILLAFVMYPVVKWLEKYRIPHIVSIILVVILILLVLYTLGIVLYSAGKNNIQSLFEDFENYEVRLTEIYREIAHLFELPFDEDESLWQNIWTQLEIRTWVTSFVRSSATIFFNFLSSAGLTVIFVIFILLEVGYFKKKIKAAFGDHSGRINKMGHDLINQVTRYLSAKFFISLGTGMITTIGLLLIGLEFAVLWGVIAFVLNFIPTLGSLVAGFFTFLFALIQFWPEPLPIILVVVLIFSTNLVIGGFLDPKIVGDHVGISPLIVLLSLMIWSWIWGFPGMVLAVPMTVVIKIICENIPMLEPVSILLGSKRAVTAKKYRRKVRVEAVPVNPQGISGDTQFFSSDSLQENKSNEGSEKT